MWSNSLNKRIRQVTASISRLNFVVTVPVSPYFSSTCATRLVFDPNGFPWMTFGLECQFSTRSQRSYVRHNDLINDQLSIVPSET